MNESFARPYLTNLLSHTGLRLLGDAERRGIRVQTLQSRLELSSSQVEYVWLHKAPLYRQMPYILNRYLPFTTVGLSVYCEISIFFRSKSLTSCRQSCSLESTM